MKVDLSKIDVVVIKDKDGNMVEKIEPASFGTITSKALGKILTITKTK